jgi:poly(A) polymerase
LPEVEPDNLVVLQRVISAEREAKIAPDALRRFSALLAPDPLLAEKVAARLKLSNKSRKRLACAAQRDFGPSPEVLAYRVGTECAVDRLLLSGEATTAASVAQWDIPKLPIGGGTLILRGLTEGPIVARTLRRIEDRWVEAGFPRGKDFERIVAEALAEASKR